MSTCLLGNMKLYEGTTDGLNLMKIVIESSVLARILAYVAENKILADLEAESYKYCLSKQLRLRTLKKINMALLAKYSFRKPGTIFHL